MNIHELDSYNLGDAVKFNDQLNPRIWGADEKMLPKVREQLLRIADDFREFLGIDLEVKDITVSGSNAAYTYTPHSDIDLHLVVDLPQADASEVYRELFDAKKYAYNDQHDIKIGGYDVELYVQDANKEHVSQGIYSLVNNDWVSVPKRRKPNVDDISVRSKFEDLGHRIEAAIATGDYEQIAGMATKVKEYRQAGLDAHGEFGAENLAFKILRKQGLIEKLYTARAAAKDQALSLDERKKKKKKSVRYGYGGYWYPGTAYAGQDHPAGTEGGGGDGGESVREDAGMTWDGVSPDTDMFTSEDVGMSPSGVSPTTTMFTSEAKDESDEQILRDFVEFCVDQLGIERMPSIKLRRDPEWCRRNRTFGRYNDQDEMLEVAWGNRHIMDVLRTVAHELTHKHQHEREAVPADAGKTGSEYENEANAQAGILMRDYAKLHPEYFAHGQTDDLEEGWRFKPCTLTSVELSLMLQKSYKTIFEQTGHGWYPHRCSNLAHFVIKNQKNLLKETAELADLFKFQQTLKNIDQRKKVNLQPGNSVSIIQVIPHTADSLIELNGFKIPKKIKNTFIENNGDIKYIEFVDGSTYPDQHFIAEGKGGGELEGTNTLFFPSQKEAEQAVTMIGYKSPEGWKLSTANIIDESLKSKLGAVAAAACIAGSPGCSTTGQALKTTQDVGRAAQTAKNMTHAGVNAELGQELRNFIRAQGGDPGSQNLSTLYQLQKRLLKKPDATNESASGYIPTKAQAKDPRYSMALTVDIKPGQVGKEANKLKLRTNKQGQPQVANPNGLFEKLSLELSQFKQKSTLAEDQPLDEVKMSPSALQQWANSDAAQGIRSGFEAELIFRDTTNGDDDDGEMEPDYDYDERARSVQGVIDFFQGGDYGGLSQREESRLEDGLNDQYLEWMDERLFDTWRDERDELIKEAWLREKPMTERVHDMLVDGMDMDDREADRIQEVGDKTPKFNSSKEQESYAQENPDYATYLEAVEGAEEILQEEVEQTIEKEDGFYDEVLDEFRENFYIDDDSSFFQDVGLSYMSDIASEYSLDWPYLTGGGNNNGGARDWNDIGSSLQAAVDMPVKVSSNYHSTARKEGQWIVEPDSSLDPDDREDFGLEIVSPPLPLLDALEKLQEVTNWANNPSEGNAYTNQSTGLHMGVSVPYKGGDVDYLKLILFLGDEYVLQSFGREANTYTKSAMQKFRENIRSGRADPAGAMALMKSNLIEFAYREIQKGVGEGKYTSAHIQDGYIEFRSAGGDWLAEESADPQKLSSTMLRYARAMSIAANPAEERQEYAKKLYKLIAPEGDGQLALFSQFSAGQIDKEQLKQQWAERTLGKTKPQGNETEWEAYDPATGKILGTTNNFSNTNAVNYFRDTMKLNNFQVREKEPEATTPRAKLAKRIAQPKQQQATAPQEIEPNVTQNFAPDYSAFERNSDRIDAIRARANQSVATTQTESINPISGAGAVPPRPVIKKISTDRVEPVEPVIKSQKPRSAIGQAISQQDIENMTQQIQMARKLGDDVNENFADGKVKGKSRPGRVKRAGASCNGSVTDLRARAKRASGEKAKMYHWCANMKSGKKKK